MPRVAAASSVVLACWLVAAAAPAFGQEGIFGNIQKGVDATFNSVTTTITDASGAVATTESHNFNPRLTLTLDSLVYPNLRLNAGGVWEVNKTFSELFAADAPGTRTDSTITEMRPYFLLRSTNAMFSPGVGFFRREDRARFAGAPGTKLVNDDYAAYLGWKPEGGPQSDFQFVRTNTFDENRSVVDTSKDFGSLVSHYTFQNLNAYYRGTYLTSDDRLRALETRQVQNSARVDYSRSFIARRLVWNGIYNVNRQELTTVAIGQGGEVALPVLPYGGLAAISDMPVTAVLSPNPPLIDVNLTAGAGVNLGTVRRPVPTRRRGTSASTS